MTLSTPPFLSNQMKQQIAMNRQYSLLQKKLEEIESMIPPLQSAAKVEMAGAFDRTEVDSKIGFLSNLLETEMKAQPGGTPYHLQHIADRLATIDTSFRKPIDFHMVPREEIVCQENDLVDAASICSCTYSCFNETDEEDGVPEADHISPAASKDTETVQFNRSIEEKADGKEREWSGSRGRCKILVVMLVVMAAVLGVATNFCMEEEHVFLVPT